MKARANGQPLVPYTMDQKAFQLFQKKAAKFGILYHAFKPLDSGKENSVQLMFAQNDLPMVQELMNQIKEELIKEDVKNGIDEDASRQKVEDNNRMESMEEFAENTGVLIPPEVFEQKMKERFGENYESEIVSPNLETAGVDKDKVDMLAEIINIQEYKKRIEKESDIEIPFSYDEKKKESDIVDQTKTHVKIATKNIEGNGEWNCIWISKDKITPALDKPVEEGEKRKAHIKKADDVMIEFPGKNRAPEKVQGKKLEKRVAAERQGRDVETARKETANKGAGKTDHQKNAGGKKK